MNRELKLQAWVDGELPRQEADLFHEQLSTHPEDQQVVDALKSVKAVVIPANELEVKVPDTRAFYWSQIQRRIEREEARTPSQSAPLISRWRRFLVPLAGVAGACALLLISLNQFVPSPTVYDSTDATPEMEALTFHDFSAGMTVVWLQDKNQFIAQAEEAHE